MTISFLDLQNIQIPSWLNDFFGSALFQKFGIIITFFYSMTPSFVFLPGEIFVWKFVSLRPTLEQFDFAILLIIIGTIGAILADILIYFGGTNLHKLKKGWKKKEMVKTHLFHKYGVYAFLLSPIGSVILLGLNEGLLLYAGHHHIGLKRLLPIIISGEIIRGLAGGIILLRFMNLI